MSYRLWVNDTGTLLVRMWANGKVEVSTRPTSDHAWSPAVRMVEEGVPA